MNTDISNSSIPLQLNVKQLLILYLGFWSNNEILEFNDFVVDTEAVSLLYGIVCCTLLTLRWNDGHLVGFDAMDRHFTRFCLHDLQINQIKHLNCVYVCISHSTMESETGRLAEYVRKTHLLDTSYDNFQFPEMDPNDNNDNYVYFSSSVADMNSSIK